MWPTFVRPLLTRLKFGMSEKIRCPKPERIEHELWMIAGGQGTKEDKTSELQSLAKHLGLPVHSSDIHCVGSTYPELFDRVAEWARNAKADRATRRTVLAAVFSAAGAIAAVVAAIWIHFQTQRLLLPLEKPIVSITDSSCKGELNKETAKLALTVNAVMKNVGKHPAENLRIRVWGAPVDDPNRIKSLQDVTCADPLYSDIPVSLPMRLEVQLQREGDTFKGKKDEVFYYVRTDYHDAFNSKDCYTRGFHLIYKIGSGSLSSATTKVVDKFDVSLKNVGAK